MRSVPSALVRVTPSGSSTNAEAQLAVSCAMPRSGSGSQARAQFGVEDGVDLSGFVAAGVADWLLALLVGPAGAVGDHVAVVPGEEVADDRFERVQLAGGGVHEPGAEVVAEPEVAVGRLGLAQAQRVAAFAVFLSGGAEFVVVEAGAGEERLFAGGLVVVVVGELFVGEVDHEDGVDDPDAVGEVLSARVDVGEASGAGALAGLRGDRDLERLGLGAGGERVELAVDLAGFAGEDSGRAVLARWGEVRAGALDLFGGVEEGAVVDADGVGVLVFDDRAVHERAEVAQCAVVQVGAGDALGDGLGEVGGDLVHVGEAVGHRDRELLAGGALGDAFADRLGEGELAA